MARVKPEELVDELSFQFRKALALTVSEMFPGIQFDERELFRAFRKAIHRKCNSWENVNDSIVSV